MLKPPEIRRLQGLMKREDDRLPIVFNALSDPKRCKIFRLLLKRLPARGAQAGERLCVSDIAKTLNISMSLASQHLKILELTGLLTRQREGRMIYFRPNTGDELVATIIKVVR